jgi:oxaloacetate decarboxylase gamma subunit
MELNLVTEGLKFMVLGMSTVFLFLVIMVGVLQVQSAIIMKFFPPKPATEPSASSGTTTSSAPDDATRIAVITAAIQMFRRKQRS